MIKQHSVLVVDDDSDLVEYISSLYHASGLFRVFSATSGGQAYRKLTQVAIDLLCTDFIMPSSGGRDLINIVLSKKEFAHLGLLVMTGHPDELVRERQNLPSRAAVLLKPFGKEDLLFQSFLILDELKTQKGVKTVFPDWPFAHEESLVQKMAQSFCREFLKENSNTVECQHSNLEWGSTIAGDLTVVFELNSNQGHRIQMNLTLTQIMGKKFEWVGSQNQWNPSFLTRFQTWANLQRAALDLTLGELVGTHFAKTQVRIINERHHGFLSEPKVKISAWKFGKDPVLSDFQVGFSLTGADRSMQDRAA